MGHGVPMARVRGAERLDALRARWHHASLKTSFMVYMLGFLLLALVMSTVTAGMFSGLQHRVIADAYEISGLYLYDAHNRTLVPRAPWISTRTAAACSFKPCAAR